MIHDESASSSFLQNRWRICGAIVSIVVIICTLYWPVHEFEFLNFDDNEYVTENTWVNSGLSWHNVNQAFGGTRGANWHPLTWISHMLDVSLFGLNAGPHHLVNVGIHTLNTTICYLLLCAITSRPWLALWGALLWGAHPLRLESVAWVSERKDVLCTFFSLLATYSYFLFHTYRARWLHYLCFTAFIGALFAKPTAMTLPIIFVLLDLWPLKRADIGEWKQLRAIVLEKIHFYVGVFVLVCMAVSAQHEGGGLKSLDQYPLAERVPTVFIGYLTYFSKFFIPTNFGIFYPFTQYQPGVAAGSFVGFASLCWLLFQQTRKHPYLVMGFVWFLVTLLPMVGILQIGGQAFADRWGYFAHAGIVIGLVALIKNSFSDSHFNVLRWVGGVISIVGVLALTSANLPHWKNSETLFRHTIAISPDNFMGNMNLGVELERQGRLVEATQHYDVAVMMRPFYPLAVMNLGRMRLRFGEFYAAEQLFARIIANPYYHLQARTGLAEAFEGQGFLIASVNQWISVLALRQHDARTQMKVDELLSTLVAQGCSSLQQRSKYPKEARGLEELQRRIERGSEIGIHEKYLSNLRKIIDCTHHTL